MPYSQLTRAIGAAMAAAIMAATFVSPAGSANAQKPENPWHVITDFETDSDHGYALRASPFDTMDELQLAAVPRGNRIHYNAPSKCVPSRLKAVLNDVSRKYGPITVNSTYRSPSKNRQIGGKKSSWHLKCAAVDFRVHAKTSGLLSYLRSHKSVGGYKRYRSGFYHIDTGPKRTW